MNTQTIEEKLKKQIAIDSNYDLHRDYLGISKIADCPRKTYREYLYDAPDVDEATYRFSFAGYEHERSILALLQRSGIGCMDNGREVVAPFDDRLRGHIDGITLDNELLEIKSIAIDKFRRVFAESKAIYKHFIQVQLYMRYGHWQSGFVIYRCRETYEHLIIPVTYQEQVADKYERKAKGILAAIDRREMPACECGRCK